MKTARKPSPAIKGLNQKTDPLTTAPINNIINGISYLTTEEVITRLNGILSSKNIVVMKCIDEDEYYELGEYFLVDDQYDYGNSRGFVTHATHCQLSYLAKAYNILGLNEIYEDEPTNPEYLKRFEGCTNVDFM